MAIYVCTDCDEKLCEQCWDVDHKNKKRSHHQKLLLYFECDLCTRGHNKKDKALPALWFCTPCKLMLCKQCWHDEHKNPKRRKHNKQFLYPDGEEGPWADVTTRAQGVEVCTDKFKGKDIVCWMRKNTDRACSVCPPSQGKAALYSCEECDPRNPEKLCEDCWFTEHKNKKRRDHRKKLLLYMCDVCHDIEGRPAFHLCADCKLKLCDACWKLEHKNPTRKNHRKGELYPSLMKGPSKGKSKGLLDQINRFLDKMKVKKRAEEPQFPAVEGTDGLFPETYQPASVHGAIGGAPSYREPQFSAPAVAAIPHEQSMFQDEFHVPAAAPPSHLHAPVIPAVSQSHHTNSAEAHLHVPIIPEEESEHMESEQHAVEPYHSTYAPPAPQPGIPAVPSQSVNQPTPSHRPTSVHLPGQHISEVQDPAMHPAIPGSFYGAAPGRASAGAVPDVSEPQQRASTFGQPALGAGSSTPRATQQLGQQQQQQPSGAPPAYTDPTSVEAQVRYAPIPPPISDMFANEPDTHTHTHTQLAKLIWQTNQPGGSAAAPAPGASAPRDSSGSPQYSGPTGSPLNKARGGVDAYYRRRLLNFYQRYNPQKLPSCVSTLIQYKGHEEALFDALQKKYGMEPRDIMDDPLAHGWKQVESSRGDIFYKHVDGRKQWERPVAQ